jgi:hypothetical protein
MGWQHVVEELYQGEVLGEALFSRMLRDLDDDRQTHEEDREVTSLMVHHETALLEVVTREAAGEIGESLAPLDGHLRFPLPPPG